MGADPDPLVEELLRERRERRLLVVAVVVGIVAIVSFGMAMTVGAFGSAVDGDHRANCGVLGYFVAPLVVLLPAAYGAVVVRRQRRMLARRLQGRH